ncbi:MAG: 6-bladed beta-propeller [Clostridium sp.]|nr:6-bladed beta-propeller [Clostridium sp.]
MSTKNILYAIPLIALNACRTAEVAEVRPLNGTTADSTQVLMVEDQYPYMNLVTEGAIPINIPDKPQDEVYKPAYSSRYLALETTDECLIGHIDKLTTDGNSLFILDTGNNSALRFSLKDGAFLTKYGQKERGPGEFTGLTDLVIDKNKKEVCLIDRFGLKQMYFNYEGELLREKPFYYYYMQMEFVGDKLAIHTGYNDNAMTPAINHNRLIISDKGQVPQYVGFAYPDDLADRFTQDMKYPLITCNDEVYFSHVLSDTIWQVKENGTCEAKFIFKFPGRDNLFDELQSQTITNEQYESITQNTPYYRDEILITKDFICAYIYHGDELLYCRSTGHIKYGHYSYQNFAQANIQPLDFTLNGTSFVKVLQPFEIIKKENQNKNFFGEYYSDYLQAQLTEEERRLLSTMTEEDNPILMIMDIEPF